MPYYKENRSVLLVGNFQPDNNQNKGVCDELAERLSNSGWRVITTSTQKNRVIRLLDMVSTIFQRRADFAIAHIDIFSGLAFIWAEVTCWALRKIRKPYVLTLHGGNLPDFAHRWPNRVKRLLSDALVVTAPSGYLLNQMQQYRKNLLLIPNPIDLLCYPFRLRPRPTPSLVWLRAFHRIYNPLLAVEVLASLKSEFPDANLTMIGPDKGDGSLLAVQSRAKELGIFDSIHLPGHVSKINVPAWLNRADIFINTTNVDNTPISVLEAMACGLCIVSTNVGGIPYSIDHQREALLVPPSDPEAMVSAIRRVLTKPELAERISSLSRQKVTNFDWKIILPKWEHLLETAARGESYGTI